MKKGLINYNINPFYNQNFNEDNVESNKVSAEEDVINRVNGLLDINNLKPKYDYKYEIDMLN